MAILWQKKVKNTQYEVRTAGATRRLYTDGVFHSQYNPNHAIQGGVWDALMLPAFFYPEAALQRILILGVGGGAVIHQLQSYIRPSEIIGIELNPVHIQIAKQFFDITPQSATLIQMDAIKWLQTYSGPPFDMILDDLFGELAGEPVRAVKANPRWMSLLHKNLTAEGLLVMNFISSDDLKNSAAVSYKKINQHYKSIFQLTLPHYANAIGAFLKRPATSQMLRNTLKSIPGLKQEIKNNNLEYTIRKLK